MEKPVYYRIRPNVIQFPTARVLKLDGETTPYLCSNISTSTSVAGSVVQLAAHPQLLMSYASTAQATVDRDTQLTSIGRAGYHIERGARSFAAYVRAMVGDLGEGVKPYLKSWYMAVKHDPSSISFEGMSTAAEVEAYGEIDKPTEDPRHGDS